MIDTTRLLRDLVAIPSVNPMGRPLEGPEIYEGRLADYLENFFRSLGVPCERQVVEPRRDNVVARFDTGARQTLLLEAHEDTVPTDNMVIEPFAAQVADGRLYGRGACDIKGGMAAMLTAFARVVRERPAGAMNLIMACAVDEEHGGLGVKRLVRDGLRADMAVVAEPTKLQIVDAHKSAVRWHITTTGRSCHSSRPDQGINAIYRMAGLLVALQQYAEWLQTSPPHPRLGPPTLSVGIVEGGTSVNTVPDRCRIEIDRRFIPGEDAADIQCQVSDYLRRTGPEIPFECSEPRIGAQPLSPERSGELVARLGAAIDAVVGRHDVMAVPYGTDAGTIAEAGIPAVVFGPGDIARAHTADEWVPLAEVEQAAEILYRLASSG
jgi:acetylornithine deacetylase